MYRRSQVTVVQILAFCLLLIPAQNCRDESVEMTDEEFQEALKDSVKVTNSLTPEERAEGWELLFDGTSLDHWRGFKQQGVPQGWLIRGGAIHFSGEAPAGDIITQEQYQDFELKLEWRVSKGGNSGIFFHASEDFDHAWESAPEMQVLDDGGHRDGANPETRAGTNYALHPLSKDVIKPAGNGIRSVWWSTELTSSTGSTVRKLWNTNCGAMTGKQGWPRASLRPCQPMARARRATSHYRIMAIQSGSEGSRSVVSTRNESIQPLRSRGSTKDSQ